MSLISEPSNDENLYYSAHVHKFVLNGLNTKFVYVLCFYLLW